MSEKKTTLVAVLVRNAAIARCADTDADKRRRTLTASASALATVGQERRRGRRRPWALEVGVGLARHWRGVCVRFDESDEPRRP